MGTAFLLLCPVVTLPFDSKSQRPWVSPNILMEQRGEQMITGVTAAQTESKASGRCQCSAVSWASYFSSQQPRQGCVLDSVQNHFDNTLMFQLLLSRAYPQPRTLQCPRLCQWGAAPEAGMEHGQDSWSPWAEGYSTPWDVMPSVNWGSWPGGPTAAGGQAGHQWVSGEGLHWDHSSVWLVLPSLFCYLPFHYYYYCYYYIVLYFNY